MKLIQSVLVSIVILGVMLGGAAFAQADVNPTLACAVNFTAAGAGVQVLVGHYKLKGAGTLHCEDLNGNVENIPVTVTVGARPFALRVAAGYLRIAGVATGVGYAASADDLLGTYVVAGVQAAAIVGGGAQVALRAAKGTVNLDATIQAADGFGFDVGFSTLTLERAE